MTLIKQKATQAYCSQNDYAAHGTHPAFPRRSHAVCGLAKGNVLGPQAYVQFAAVCPEIENILRQGTTWTIEPVKEMWPNVSHACTVMKGNWRRKSRKRVTLLWNLRALQLRNAEFSPDQRTVPREIALADLVMIDAGSQFLKEASSPSLGLAASQGKANNAGDLVWAETQKAAAPPQEIAALRDESLRGYKFGYSGLQYHCQN